MNVFIRHFQFHHVNSYNKKKTANVQQTQFMYEVYVIKVFKFADIKSFEVMAFYRWIIKQLSSVQHAEAIIGGYLSYDIQGSTEHLRPCFKQVPKRSAHNKNSRITLVQFTN